MRTKADAEQYRQQQVALGEAEGRRRLLAAAVMVLGAATVLWSALP